MVRENGLDFTVDRRTVLKTAGTGTLSVSFAGCSRNVGDTGGSGGELSGKTLKIGALCPSPNAWALGSDLRDGAKLAASQISGTEKVGGAEVEVLVGNTKAVPGPALEEHRRLTVQENVDVTLGLFMDSVWNAVMESIAQQETLHIGCAGPSPVPLQKLKRDYEKYKYFFRSGPARSSVYGNMFSRYIDIYKDILGWDSVAVLIEDIVPADPFAAAMREGLKEIIEVPVFKRTSESLSNWTPIFDEIEASGADHTFITAVLSGYSLVNQWAKQKRQFEMGGIHFFSMVPKFWDETNGAAEHVWTFNTNSPQTTNTPRTKPYVNKFIQQFDRAPIYVGAMAFDAVNIYAKAVRETGSTDPEELIPYMEKMEFNKSVWIPDPPGVKFNGPDHPVAPHDLNITCMVGCEKPMGVPIAQQWQQKPGKEPTQECWAPHVNKTSNYTIPKWIDGRPSEIEVPGQDATFPYTE